MPASNDKVADIPSPVDFHDPSQARAWIDETVRRRPWRPGFFAAFVAALNVHMDRPGRVAELGSGPGHLAREILKGCPCVASYTAIDFSAAMHDIAKDHIGDKTSSVNFLRRDFKRGDWAAGLSAFDAVLTMQAAHEVRHVSRLPVLLHSIHDAVSVGGVLLFCDHYAEPGSTKHPGLYPFRQQQPALLAAAGFSNVELLHDEGGMALYRGIRTR